MKRPKTLLFFGLCLVYTLVLLYLVRLTGRMHDGSSERLGPTLRFVVLGCLMANYVFLALEQFLVGRVATEYIVIMPVLTLITSFLVGAVLGVFGFSFSQDPFVQAAILHLIFSLTVALRMWRRFWLPQPKQS